MSLPLGWGERNAPSSQATWKDYVAPIKENWGFFTSDGKGKDVPRKQNRFSAQMLLFCLKKSNLLILECIDIENIFCYVSIA